MSEDMNDRPIDEATFADLQDAAGEDFVKELIDTFFEEAPMMLGELRDAFATGDADKFRRAAHSLKSNSHTFGAQTLGTRARDLELKGLPPDTAPLDALDAEYARTAAALKALRDA